MEGLLEWMVSLKYPQVDVLESGGIHREEVRLHAFEWLLKQYDDELSAGFATLGRVSRVSHQLAIIAVGGTKASQVEAAVLVGGDVDSNKVVKAMVELCRLIQTKTSGAVGDFARDLAAAAEVAAHSGTVFSETITLFPPSVQVGEMPQPLPDVQSMRAVLEGLREKLAAMNKKTNTTIATSTATMTVPVSTPSLDSVGLAESLTEFGISIDRFTRMYLDEMASWKVEASEPNMRISELATDLRKKQQVFDELLRCHEVIRSSYDKMEALGKQLDTTLDVGVVADETVAALQRSMTTLQRLRN